MKVRVCPNCGKHNSENIFDCIECGATLSVNTLVDVENTPIQNRSPKTSSTEIHTMRNNQPSQNNVEATVIITCENCGQKLRIPLRRKNLRVACPKCRHEFNYEFVEEIPVSDSSEKKALRVAENKPSKKVQLDQFIEALKELISAIDPFTKLLNDRNNQQIWVALLETDLITDFRSAFKYIPQIARSFTIDSRRFGTLSLNQKIKEFQSWSLPMSEDEFANPLQSARNLTFSLKFRTTMQQGSQPTDFPRSEKQVIEEEVKQSLINTFEGFSDVLASIIPGMEELSQVVKGLSNDFETMPSELKTHLERDSRPTRVCGVCYGKKEFPCSGCYESGACQLCNGQGEIKAMVGVNKDGDEIIRKTPCPACKGSGLCTICHGSKIMKCTECRGTGLTSG